MEKITVKELIKRFNEDELNINMSIDDLRDMIENCEILEDYIVEIGEGKIDSEKIYGSYRTERNVKIIGYGEEIEVELVNEFEDDFEVRYYHPQTGETQQEIKQIKTGWSFQSEVKNENYDKLINAISEMESDDMLFDYCQDVSVLNIEDTPYTEEFLLNKN